jgi:hypothetical protein
MMSRLFLSIFTYVFLAVTFSAAAGTAVQAQVRSYRVTDRQVQTLINRIETRTDTFRRQFVRSLDRSRVDGTRSEDMLASYVTDFENATDSLRRRFDDRTSTAADVREVLARASVIENFIRTNRLSVNAERQWSLLSSDLNTLASYYNVRDNWRASNYGGGRYNNNDRYNDNVGGNYGYGSGYRGDAMLTGTYRLNINRSDNISAVIDRAVNNISVNDNRRERIRRNLERRLNAPDMLAIEKVNRRVTIASSMSPQVTFDADNVSRSEVSDNGRTVSVRAQTTGDGVTVNYEGDRMNDYFINFDPEPNGQLRVTRRLYLENQNETVTVTSIYDKIDRVARWSDLGGAYNNNTAGNNYPSNTNYGDFVVPNGTRLVAVLNTPLSTEATTNGERFTMEVTSPNQYRGAIIEGTVGNAERSGRVSGRAEMSLNFETIRLRNGQTYRFAGLIDQVRTRDGDTVSINNEGAVRDRSQTTRTVTRAGIGAALGALIGAIAGGGQGAAIGATIGAGAGAGSVILQGRDNLKLDTGTEFTLTSSAPGNLRGSNY